MAALQLVQPNWHRGITSPSVSTPTSRRDALCARSSGRTRPSSAPEASSWGSWGYAQRWSRGCSACRRQELCAQVNLFHELTGQNPQHMDGHQHVHVLPRIRQVFAQILREHGICYTRIPVELGLHECTWVQKELMEFYKGVEEDARNTVDVFKSHGIRWPDIYIGLSTMGRNMSTRNIQRAIDYSLLSLPASLPPGLPRHSPPSTPSVSMELMTHPGYPSLPTEGGCGEGPDDFSRSRERLHELEVLRDPSLQSYYKEHKVQLCAFRDL
ncbi:carbohydrate deacetylase isoform X2 [Ascaphus truei]|uniref:carbohydrate deacetylase isoform X2 n=1 Tax=Ascaphus truei TaxID=8439 RepID=UPI003F5915D7